MDLTSIKDVPLTIQLLCNTCMLDIGPAYYELTPYGSFENWLYRRE